MNELKLGLKLEYSTIVTADLAVNFLGLESARVLGTPFMIMLMEMTSRNCVKPHLSDGLDTVGTVVNIRHLAATPLGSKIRFTSELIGIEGKRVTFKVTAFDEREKIGEGEHERAVIDIAKFGARVSEKRSL
jgi:fluoroacetyl-CoA thioesterase